MTDHCANCDAHLMGRYCHVCGQKQVDADWLSVAPFIRQIGIELSNLDFKSVRSLLALLRPGYLAAEFLAGRKRRYLSPLKLYFLSAALFFFIAPYVSGFNLQASMRHDHDGMLRAMVEHRMAQKQMDFELFAQRFNLRRPTIYTMSLGVSAIAAALILRLLFRRAAPLLGTHIVFALYYVSFFYLVAIVIGALNEALEPNHLVLLAVTYGILIPYVFFALRRVYREPAGRTFAKCLVLLIAAFVIDSPINIVATRLSIALS